MVSEVFKHRVICIEIDLSGRTSSIFLARFWNSTRHVVKFVAVEINPVPPLSPMVRKEQCRGGIILVSTGLRIERKDAVVVKRSHYLLKTISASIARNGELLRCFRAVS
ncbi:hypothetical protein RRF57_012505 [Xylaria bambusicola]|uniref:Uncharacterized protein n=1 Tax=Xylaria bambusicola TaxID=326684 RepID=A0AAN7V499_9PEZI